MPNASAELKQVAERKEQKRLAAELKRAQKFEENATNIELGTV